MLTFSSDSLLTPHLPGGFLTLSVIERESLSSRLKAIHVASLLLQAEIIADATDDPVRLRLAELFVRQAMYDVPRRL